MTAARTSTGRTVLTRRLARLLGGRPRTRVAPAGGPRFRPALEALEERRVPANFLVIDFTPDAMPGEYQNKPFADTFNLRDAYGRPYGFLDMNRDGIVNATDVSLAAQQVYARVGRYLQGFNISVYAGDLWQDTGWGKSWLTYGQRSAQDQVFVVYAGGWNLGLLGLSNIPTTVAGVANQAPVGYNNEFYALAWTSTLAELFPRGTMGPVTPSNFVEVTAWTIAHEFGHLTGLGHTMANGSPYDFNDTYHSVMNYLSGTQAQYAQYPNAVYPNIELRDLNGNPSIGSQNPAVEMALSLQGQPTAPSNFRAPYTGGQGQAGDPSDGPQQTTPELDGGCVQVTAPPTRRADGAAGGLAIRHESGASGTALADGLFAPHPGGRSADLAVTSLGWLTARRAVHSHHLTAQPGTDPLFEEDDLRDDVAPIIIST